MTKGKYPNETLIAKRLEVGNPQIYIKKVLPKYLTEKFFFGIVLNLFIIVEPVFYFLIEYCDGRERNNKPMAELPDEHSAFYGINDTKNFNVNIVFRVVYSLIYVILFVVSIILMIFFAPVWVCILVGIFLFGFVIEQIFAVNKFKNEINCCVCQKCGWANTMRFNGDKTSGDTYKKDIVVRTINGGSNKTGTVYVGNTKVGEVYSTSSPTNIYQTIETHEYSNIYICIHCGGKSFKKQYDSKKVGEEHYYHTDGRY